MLPITTAGVGSFILSSHALGLDHVADPESLMYPVNKAGGLQLTDKDAAELDRVCR